MIIWRAFVPALLGLTALAGCLPTPETRWSPSTVEQARVIDALTDADRLRPSDEDIAKSFRRAIQDHEVQEAARASDEPAVTGPVPLPKERPRVASAEAREQLFRDFLKWRNARARQ